MVCIVHSLGFGFCGLVFRVWESGFGVEGLGCMIHGLESRE